jgi:phage portal protein BeeE
VKGTKALNRRTMALVGRSLALRGESVFLIKGEQLVPCSDWDIRTRDGRPSAYRVSVSESGGGTSQTALAGEVLHIRIGCDPAAPYYGTAPLKRASLTAGMLHAVEASLSEVFELAPIGSQVVPMPEQRDTDSEKITRSFRGQRGRVLLRESVQVSAAGGPAPQTDWKPASLSPDLEAVMPAEMLAAARDAVCGVFGVLPALFSAQGQGPMTREAQRHLATWCLQPIAELLAEEATEKLGSTVAIDVLTPLQAFDQGGSARAVATLVQAAAQAKEAGLDPAVVASAFQRMDWEG